MRARRLEPAALISLALVVFGVLATVLGPARPPGRDAWTEWTAWLGARRFEEAAARDEPEALLRTARTLLARGGASGPVLFAADRVGYQMTAPSWHATPSEARARALEGVLLLEEALPRLSDPWEARRLQAWIVVHRLLPGGLGPASPPPGARPDPELAALAVRAVADWLAGGGGPQRDLGDAYREVLTLPKAERPGALLGMVPTAAGH